MQQRSRRSGNAFDFSEDDTRVAEERRLIRENKARSLSDVKDYNSNGATRAKAKGLTVSVTPAAYTRQVSAPMLTPLCMAEQETTSQIIPHLLISNRGDALLDDAHALQTSGIVYLVNCCENSGKRARLNHLRKKKGFNILDLDLKDEPTFDLTNAFESVFPFITQAKQENRRCLIYCHSGMSRSVTLVLAYLIVCERMTLIEAMSLVKNRRQLASPNPGFMAQLIALERSIDKYKGGDGTSVTVDLERYKHDRFGDPEAFTSAGKDFQYYFYKRYTKRIYNINTCKNETSSTKGKHISSSSSSDNSAAAAGRKGHNRDISATTFLLPLVEKSLAKATTTVKKKCLNSRDVNNDKVTSSSSRKFWNSSCSSKKVVQIDTADLMTTTKNDNNIWREKENVPTPTNNNNISSVLSSLSPVIESSSLMRQHYKSDAKINNRDRKTTTEANTTKTHKRSKSADELVRVDSTDVYGGLSDCLCSSTADAGSVFSMETMMEILRRIL